jgi:uncharacterized protein YhaN
MRVRALHLLSYGPFRERTLRFENDGGLEVVYGPNEAGKSTTRRAVLALFFGVPERTKDGHSVDELRVGATLEDGARTLDVVRRKGRKNTLLDATGAPLDEQVLAGMLGGLGESAYETTYGLDHETLRRGGDALRVGKGELGETLFAAATGLTGLHGVLVALREEAESLFVPSGTKRPWNEAQRSFAQAKRLADVYATSAEKWQEAQAQLRDARAEIEARRVERAALAGERARARAAMEAWRALEGHRARAAELATSLAAVRAELAAIVPADALLARSQAIADLQERLGSHRKAHADRPRMVVELELVEERARRAKRDAPRVDGEVRGDLPADAHVRTLSLEGAELRQRAREVEAREADAAANAERAAARVSASRDARDASELRDALERVRREGDLEARVARARDAARRTRASSDAMIASLELGGVERRDAPLDALVALGVPTMEAISMAARGAVDLAARVRAASERRRRLEEDRADAERALGALRAEGDVPTEEALARARAERDAHWDALRASPKVTRVATTRYERAVRAADDVADRLRREAARVTRALEIEAGSTALARKLEIARDEERALGDEATSAARAWEALWASSKITPRSPDEMGAWRTRFDATLVEARRAAEASDTLAPLEAAESAARESLGSALAREGVRVDAAATASSLEQRARRLLAERDKALAERAAAEAALESAERERERAARQRATFERDRAQWSSRWTAAARAIGLDESASPEELIAALDAASSLARIDDEADKLRRRLAGIDRDATRFAADVRDACAVCAPDLADAPAEEACVELARRVARASEQRARREALDDQERKLDAQERVAREVQSHAEHEAPVEPPQTDVDALDARIAELDEIIQQQNRDLGSLEAGAKQFDQSPAIEQADEAQRQLSRVRDLTERYVRARLAASAVARLLERYRKENQGPVLERASALFATLTLGAFHGLEVGFSASDEPVLVAIRDGRRLETSALSDGTLDQLYLALRVASLERLTAARGALPLLLDDVLVHFDDQRAAAALAVLSDLARHTQIILFTHHERIVELAKRAIADRDGERTASVHDLAARVFSAR